MFSDETGILYEVSMPSFNPVILAIDPNTLNLISSAPALPMIPYLTELEPSFFIGIPFAVDSSGIVLERQDYGIAFDDSTDNVVFNPLTPGTPPFLQHMTPQFGPLAGGTTSGGFGNAFSLAPDVWYGANRGTASLSNAGTLSITSPPGVPGPVDVKFLFPDGIEVYDPLFFSYGPFIQYSIQSGAAPTGGATAQIGGYGLPANAGSGSIAVGGSPATITGSAVKIGSLTFGGYPFPAGTVNFTVPPGSPGFANITVNTTAGSSTFPKGIFYAQSVSDFASADSLSAVLYDGNRQQLYLSAGDHIDVFSLSAGHFIAPITPPAQSTQKRFAGMALSPDGSTLFAADLNDGSLAVINPDNPATSSFIAVAPVDTGDARCTRGPLYVATGTNNHVYVVTGGLPAIGCGPGGDLFQIDTVAKTSTAFGDVKCGPNPLSGSFVSSSHDGTKIAFSNCVYDENTAIFSGFRFNFLNQQTISGDGNVAAGLSTFLHYAFSDMTGNIIDRVALADPYYGSIFGGVGPPPVRQEPLLNDSGSLFFQPWQQFFDIVDVQHGTLSMRFSLTQNILDVGVPMAVDSGGRHVYLITDRGLTIVDLGSAILSVGSLSPAAAAPGTQITVRGSGFDLSTSATLGSQAASVTFVDENTLKLTVPALTSGPTDLLLTKSGGLSYRLENAVNIP